MSTSEQLLRVLEDTASSIRRTEINLKKCPKQRLTKGYLESRAQCIEAYWKTFVNAHQQLIQLTTREERGEMQYFLKEDYYAVEELYICLQGDIKDTLAAAAPAQGQGSTSLDCTMFESVQQQVKLPAIVLPVFSNNYEEWPTFHDLFTSLVHDNTSLSKVQKLHYLKSSIAGEAAALLKHVTITEQNYEPAWKTLKQRYGNKKIIVNSILKRLFNQRKCTTQTSSQIKSLLDTTTQCLNDLQNLQVNVDACNPFIIYLVVNRLDPETHKAWEEHSYNSNADQLPKWSELRKYLESKFRTLELVNPVTATSATVPKETRPIKEKSYHVSTPARSCVLCRDEHTLCHCKEFTQMSAVERMDYVKKSNLCFNCLLPGHSASRCRLSYTCRLCRKRHHTLIHQAQNTVSDSTKAHHSQMMHSDEDPHQDEVVEISSNLACRKSTALLATAMVSVRDDEGHVTPLRALIDQGSQSSFISERAAQALRVKRVHAKGIVTGVGSTQTTINGMAHLHIFSNQDDDVKLNVKAYIMSSNLTSQLPASKIMYDTHAWPHIQGLTLADPNFHQPGRVDMLLGVEVCAQIFKSKIIQGPPGSPCAQETSLGWILFGKVEGTAHTSQDNIIVMHHQVNVDDMLRAFWEIDTTDTKKSLTRDEEKCETIYKETHTRTEVGRYVVRLPFNKEEPLSPKGQTRDIAMLRLKQLERRFEKDATLKMEYVKAMEEYIELKYMEEVPKEELNNTAVYLPHQVVRKEEKETTKTRIVFNASSKGCNGVSLNEELLIGPHLQEDMRNLVMRWRLRRIAMISDIKKMYLQVLMNPEDTDYQRILWRKDTSDPVKDYRLLRVTFGTASAPYLAVKTLQQVAEDEGKEYPIASQIIKEDFFMDDLMTGFDTVEEAVDTAKQICEILKKGGFTLQKWASNSSELLQEFAPSERSTHVKIDIELGGTIKALGLCWNMGEDTFQYTLNLSNPPEVITKRNILADIQRLFDPLGWISPALLPAKRIIQKLWLLNVGWDEEVNTEIKEEWLHIRKGLDEIKNIKLDRWLNTTPASMNDVAIHGYCDASNSAYGAVAYLRVRIQDGEYKTFLLAAKTRVGPVKPMTVPKLELCGAVLLSRLLKQISEATRIPTNQMFAWTDSTIVLAWLRGDPTRWQTFVRNRVVAIQDIIPNRWYHVRTSENPADIASRGMPLGDLKNCSIWWHGPQWLKHKDIKLEQPIIEETDLEMRKKAINVNLNINEGIEVYKTLPEKFEEYESLPELLKSIVYARRFLTYLKEKTKNTEKTITTEELDTALQICIKAVQDQCFKEDIESLRKRNRLNTRSKLRTLNPYLDQNNILRVGGRLCHSALDEERKHPVILSKCHLTYLIIDDAHRRTLHGRYQLTLNYLRSKYWILKVKGLLKTYIIKCLKCARHNATTKAQLMGDLPKQRVTPAKPFLNSGVDFAGPYQILMSKGRGSKTSKAYIGIFVCMATKAIHLELVSDLTSEAFIGAFRRFVARRGRCAHIWSDQGRNFVGASKELADSWREAKLELDGEVAQKLALDGTQWHFVPAYSPTFGGLWEAGVRSMKYHLKRILNTHLTYEEMSTVLCQIESCLNSRPLCPIDDNDIDSMEVLTPGHFLLTEAPITVPSPSLKDTKISSLSRWRFTQKIVSDFWRQWQQEYLCRLQQRPKWLKIQEELQVGQIVVIKSENLPPGKWQLGRIVEKHPGADNLTRVYSVKSGNTVIKRTITKLCLMPVDTES
jgi:hypothetical protein